MLNEFDGPPVVKMVSLRLPGLYQTKRFVAPEVFQFPGGGDPEICCWISPLIPPFLWSISSWGFAKGGSRAYRLTLTTDEGLRTLTTDEA